MNLIQLPGKRAEQQALSDLETSPVVYFAAINGLVKIGTSKNLRQRLHALGAKRSNLLAVVPGSVAVERAIHALFRDDLARGYEWFRPSPALMQYVNFIRFAYNVPEVVEADVLATTHTAA